LASSICLERLYCPAFMLDPQIKTFGYNQVEVVCPATLELNP